MATLVYSTLSEVPEDIRDSAKEGEDGKYTVKVAAAEKITEFRENNVKLSQQRDDLVAKLTRYEQVTGVSIEEAGTKLVDFAKTLEALRDTKKRVDDGALVENTSLEEAAAARVTEVTNNLKSQLAEMARDRDAQKERAKAAEDSRNQMMVENSIRLAASDPDVAMLDKAVNLVLPQAFKVFRIEEGGKLTPKTSDGTVIYGSDGVTPMSVKEWLLKQRDDNDFLFKGSRGGGASGSDSKTAGRLNAAELAKMTPQQRMNYARKHGLA
jgi:hypothetical protein